MAYATESTATAEQVAFEPDDVTFADDRVVVTGRWSGVRGRRFVRPTLTVVGDGAPSRMLAELEHKPWIPEDGAPWTASFSYAPENGGAEEVELAVAPDIAVVLPAPEPLRSRPRRAKSRGRSRRGTSASSAAPAAPAGAAAGADATATVAARAKTEEQRAEIARLKEQLGRHELARAEWRAATSKRDAAVAKLDAVLEERDAAVAERDVALSQRDVALSQRDVALSQRDTATQTRDTAVSERDVAVRRRDIAVGALDTAVKARERLVHERDRLAAELEQARGVNIPAPAPAFTEPTARLPAMPVSHQFPGAPAARDPGRGPVALWAARLAALAVLLVVLAALALILQSV